MIKLSIGKARFRQAISCRWPLMKKITLQKFTLWGGRNLVQDEAAHENEPRLAA